MKVKLIAAALAVSLILGGCGSKGTDVLINADGYEGILATEENTSVTAAPMPAGTSEVLNTSIPQISNKPEDLNTSEISDKSDISESSEMSASVSEETSFKTEAVTSASSVTESETETPITTAVTAVSSASVEFITDDNSEAVTDVPTTTSTAAASETTSVSETTAAVTTTTAEIPASAETEPSVSFVSGSNSYQTLNYSEIKGVWISYLELNSLLTGKSEGQFTASIREAFENCANMGLNTVFVHVRSHGDAYYKSEYYPWSKYVTGTLGQAPDFDPLEIMVREATQSWTLISGLD